MTVWNLKVSQKVVQVFGVIVMLVGAYFMGVESQQRSVCYLDLVENDNLSAVENPTASRGVSFPIDDCAALERVCISLDPDYPPCIGNMLGGCYSRFISTPCHWSAEDSVCSCLSGR